jgi:hypothetical protein
MRKSKSIRKTSSRAASQIKGGCILKAMPGSLPQELSKSQYQAISQPIIAAMVVTIIAAATAVRNDQS